MLKIKELKNHAGFIKYFKNTSWLFIENILRLLVGFFVGVWVARYLGPDKYGIFNYSIAFVSIFSGIANLGLDEIVVRELVKEPEKKDIYLGTAFWLKLIAAFISIILVTIAVFLLESDKITRIYILIISFGTIFQSFNVIDFHFRSRVMAKYVSICKMIQLIISCCLKIYLIITRADLIWFVSVTLFDAATLAISLNIAYRSKNKSSFYSHFDHNIAITMLKNSWPLIFGSLAATIYMRIDQIMVKNMLNATDAGYYAVAVRISDIWLFITVVITQSLMPAIINAKKVNEELYLKRIQMQYDLLVKIAVIISAIITIFGYRIINFLFGSEYIPSVPVLQIYVWSILFVFLSNGSWAYYINENLQTIAGLRLMYGAIINIVLNYYLIPICGLKGAAIATLISYSISSYFVNAFHPKTRKNFILQTKAILNIYKLNNWRNVFL
jgi:O-antigen/teichoic acid export membrane protein